MKRSKWTPEKVAEMAKWQKDNDKSASAVAEHFKLASPAAWERAKSYYGLKLKKKNPRKYTKAPKFIDMPLVSEPAKVMVIVCAPEQLASVLKGAM